MNVEPGNLASDPIDFDELADTESPAHRVLKEGLAAAERGLLEVAKRVERAVKESMETIRAQTGDYSGDPARTAQDAQRYIVDRVEERPVAAAFVGLGVGFLLGALFFGRRK